VRRVHDVDKASRDRVKMELEREYHVVCVDKATGEPVDLPPDSKVWIVRTDPTMPEPLWNAGLVALEAYAEALNDTAPDVASDIRKHVVLHRTARDAFQRNAEQLAATPDATTGVE
jgi:hypothetical protein